MRQLLQRLTPRAGSQAVGWFLLGVLIWLAHMRLPLSPAFPDLDQSWQQALSRALVEGIRFGRELVFTYGPLGGPAQARYEPALFWPDILLFEFLFKGLLAWRWIVALRRHSSVAERTVYALALICLALPDDTYYEATQVMLGSLLLRDALPGRRERAQDLLLVVAIGFIKFPYFCLGAGVAALVCVHAALRSRREMLQALALWAVCLLGVWTLCGQRPWDLPVYVWRSMDVAHGYTEAQALDGPVADIWRACGSFLLLGLLGAIHVRTSPDRRLALLRVLLVAGGVATAFRASFTCQGGPAVVFFCCVTLAPCAWVGAQASARVLRSASWVLAIASQTGAFQGDELAPSIFFGATAVETSARGLWELPGLRAKREAELAGLQRRYDLPRIRGRVGQKPIDMVGCDLAWLFLNRLNWQPRPVLQSYSTSTEDLIRLNGEFLEGPAAPEFLLYQDAEIAERMAWMSDSESRFAVLRSYVPVEFEKGLLLLRRHPGRAGKSIPPREKVAEYDLRPGQPLRLDPIPGKLLIARFDVRYSWLGELRRMLLHAPETRIQIVRSDHYTFERRLLPDMARAGVLVRPVLEFTDDLLAAYLGQPTRNYDIFKVFSTSDWSELYEPTWHIVIERCDELLPTPQPERVGELMLGGLGTRPSRFRGSTPPVCIYQEQQERVYFAADAELEFDLGERVHHLSGLCGQLEDSLQKGDGIDFEVELRPAGGEPRRLWTRTLDRSQPDSKLARIDLEFPPAAGQTLVLRWRNQPGHGPENDQPFLCGITLGQ